MVAYNFAAQNRAVTLNDYKSMIETMPATFGAPAKVSVMEEDNKVRIKLLSYDETGNLIDTVSNTLKNNVLNYLSKYRMLNDYLDIQSGEVIDLGLEVDLVVNKNENTADIIKSVVQQTSSFFSIDKKKMGDPLLVGDLKTQIGNVVGVVNVIDIRVFNKIGGEYSSAQVAQSYIDETTKEISQVESTVYMKSNQIYQVRFPNTDIKVRIKTLTSTTY
jgi:dsRNA-specific ribonuclease